MKYKISEADGESQLSMKCHSIFRTLSEPHNAYKEDDIVCIHVYAYKFKMKEYSNVKTTHTHNHTPTD